MKQTLRMRAGTAIFLALSVLVAGLGGSALAQTAQNQNDQTVVFGKVTAIGVNSIMVATAAMAMPDGTRQRDQNQATPAPGENRDQGGRGNFQDRLTYTGETVTVQITSDVTLTKQGERQPDTTSGATLNAGQDGQQPQGTPPVDAQNGQNGQQGNLPSGAPQGGFMMGFMGQGDPATMADITIGSIVVLTYQASTNKLLSVFILNTNSQN